MNDILFNLCVVFIEGRVLRCVACVLLLEHHLLVCQQISKTKKKNDSRCI